MIHAFRGARIGSCALVFSRLIVGVRVFTTSRLVLIVGMRVLAMAIKGSKMSMSGTLEIGLAKAIALSNIHGVNRRRSALPMPVSPSTRSSWLLDLATDQTLSAKARLVALSAAQDATPNGEVVLPGAVTECLATRAQLPAVCAARALREVQEAGWLSAFEHTVDGRAVARLRWP